MGDEWKEALDLLEAAQQWDFLADHAKDDDPEYRQHRGKLDAFLKLHHLDKGGE